MSLLALQIVFWAALSGLGAVLGAYIGRRWGEGACRSRIYLGDGIENRDRQSWNEAERLYPCYVRRAGRWEAAMLTHQEIVDGIRRAAKPHNREEMPPRLRWWQIWNRAP